MQDESTSANAPTPRAAALDEPLAWLLLLPALILAWPGPNPIAGDFATTELSGTGVALLASVPVALFIAWRRVRPVRGLWLLLFAWFALTVFAGGSDSLQRDRALMGLSVGVVLALAGGALAAIGRATFVRGLAIVSILLLVRALLQSASGLGGVLGNSGELSAAALPGALAGMHLWARAQGKSRWLGLAALGLFLLHAVMAPVLTSLLALAIVAALSALRGERQARLDDRQAPAGAARSKLIVTCLAAVLGLAGVKFGVGSSAAPGAQLGAEESEAPPTVLGGVEVRKLVWGSTLDLVADHPFTGVGAGQFASAFPQYRDPVEIELSNWQRQVEAVTEVEHPHNDWLLPFAEGGLAVGILWTGFLLLVLLAAWRLLSHECATRAALGAAAMGVLVSALTGAPLSYNAPASVVSFALFGAVLSRAELVQAPKRYGRLLAPAAALVMLLFLPRAWSMWMLGLSLIETTQTESTTAQAISVDAALAHTPDSVVALSLEAQLVEHHDRDLEAALAVWERVLVLRPLRFEALMNSGQLLARTGQLDAAAKRFDAALAIDPGHPGLLRNRVACAADRGLVEEALRELDALEATGHGDALWLLDLGCDLILRGRDREALPLLARADERFAELTPEKAWGLDSEYRRSGNRAAADAFKAFAHAAWAREQAADGDWDDARRSYRQNMRITRERIAPHGPTRLRMEMAAVLWHSRMPEDAKQMLEGLSPSLADWAAMPAWAGQTLFEMGFGVE